MIKQGKFEKLIESEIPMFVDFHATWCGPCKAMDPVIKTFSQDLKGQLRVIKIDIDKNVKVAQQLEIRGVPTFALFHRGKQLWRQSGMMTLGQLKQVVNIHLAQV